MQAPPERPEDFRPWINVDDARRKGQTVDEYAEATAQTWGKGLADWGQGPERIQMLKDVVDYTIYTPGSDAQISVSILGSLAAPKLSSNPLFLRSSASQAPIPDPQCLCT